MGTRFNQTTDFDLKVKEAMNLSGEHGFHNEGLSTSVYHSSSSFVDWQK